MYLLGLDYGTTSLKAVVFDDMGQQAASKTADYNLIAKGDTVEFDAIQYWEIFKDCYDEISKNFEISALAVDTQCETLILADENGNPLRHTIVWLDNRAAEEAKEIEAVFGAKKVYEVTGQPEIAATWPACKLLWVKKHEPEVWAKVRKVFLLEDYLLYKLTGRFVTERTLQSSSLYFDIRTGEWWQEMLDFLELPKEYLPEIYDSCKKVGEYGNTAVVTSAIDQIAGAIGAGVVKNGIVSEMTGTTLAVFVPSDRIPKYNPESKVPCHYNFDGNYCLLMWTTTAGMALKWFRNSFCESFDFSELDELAKNVPVGSAGLVMLPHLSGSTMPKYNPDAKGAFYGITLEHTRGHFVRSILESVSCMLKQNLDYLGADVHEIRSMGGGANSPLWCQIKSDMTGKRLVTLKTKETACLGSAIMAGVGIGAFKSVEEACGKFIRLDRVYEPSGEDYNLVYEKYCRLDNILNIKEGVI